MIHKVDGKVIVIAGEGDIVWGIGEQEKGKPDCILIGQGAPGKVGRKLPELVGKKFPDWAVKIVMPSKESYESFVAIVKDYGEEMGYCTIEA